MFLATLLILGTIATILPTAQAQPYNDDNRFYPEYPSEYTDRNSYEQPREYLSYQQEYSSDNSYYKSKDSNVILKKINCNNNNVNVNGLELNGLPPFIGNLLAPEVQADNEGQYDASYYGSGSGGQSGYDKNNNSFKFVCVNNNNNTVVVNESTPVPPIEDECVLCLNANATFAEIITRALEEPGPITISSSLFTLIIGEDVTTIPELCDLLREEILAGNVDQSEQHLREVFYVVEFVDPDTDAVRFSESVASLVECLLNVDFG